MFLKYLRAYLTNRRLPTNHQASDLGQCSVSTDHGSFDVEEIVSFDWKVLDHYWHLGFRYYLKLNQGDDPRSHGNRRKVYGRVRRIQDCLNSVCGYWYLRCQALRWAVEEGWDYVPVEEQGHGFYMVTIRLWTK